jgi:hypothetical protein
LGLELNAMSNAMDGMTGLSVGEYVQYKELREIGVLLLKEAISLVKTAGIHLEPLPGIALAVVRFMISLPVPVAAWLLKVELIHKIEHTGSFYPPAELAKIFFGSNAV